MTHIKFGTSGWRGIIANDFTFSNVEIVSQAIANYVIEKGLSERGVVISYDNRFLSPEFAQTACKVMVGNRIKVYMTKSATPTPVNAFSILHHNAGGGIMVTASHNPPHDNGIKFSDANGGPASKEVTNIITEHVNKISETKEIKVSEDLSSVTYFDPKEDYLNSLFNLIDIDTIKSANLKVIANPLFGAGIGYLEEALERAGCDVVAVNNYRDPLFGEGLPEPDRKNMSKLFGIMYSENAILGLGVDGDADRFGIIDKDGNFISPNQVLYLLMDYLIRTRGFKGKVARTVATTYMLNRLGEKYGIEVIETPVGFKYIAEGLLHNDVFLGGEESGGLSIRGHVPEKDGILACLLITEMVARYGKTPTDIMENLKREVGYLYSDRIDIKCTQETKDRVLQILTEYKPETIAGNKVINKIDMDGMKYVMQDGSWVLIRPSGTESLFRVYAEGNSMDQIKNIQQEVINSVGLINEANTEVISDNANDIKKPMYYTHEFNANEISYFRQHFKEEIGEIEGLGEI